ncbi:MarR family winged helix-turn-helix transcriptional regulator [Primorskyibacter sp. S187A]|uniref:MarR family winged helix-turn-helix transcriptional regulator n=1 Tax=Primorskyibacter sp. S187A TaxID=3415130 RepID=UPI003C798179
MTHLEPFTLNSFTPYLLNIAAEHTSLAFQPAYKERYGMLRTEWRVLFHLGQRGEMTAKQICTEARIHKTKVSRAVAALQAKRFLTRQTQETDRRLEILSLTAQGRAAFDDLCRVAQAFDDRLMARIPEADRAVLKRCLAQLADL